MIRTISLVLIFFLISGISRAQGTGPLVVLNYPRVRALCAGPEGSLYLSLRNGPSLLQVDLDGNILRSWTDGPNLPKSRRSVRLSPRDFAFLSDIKDMVADKIGNLYFIMYDKPGIYKLENDRVTRVAGLEQEIRAFPDYGGQIGGSLHFWWASESMDLTIDKAGNLFLASRETRSIWKIKTNGKTTLLPKEYLYGHSDKPFIAVGPKGEVYFTGFPLTNETIYRHISRLNPDGKTTLLTDTTNENPAHQDGIRQNRFVTLPSHLQADSRGNLFFMDCFSASCGKTFWHFNSMRRLSPDGKLQTVAGCGSDGNGFNYLSQPFYKRSDGKTWKLVNGKVNGNNFSETSQGKGQFKAVHPDLIDPGPACSELELMGESNYGLFFRTGDDHYNPLFTIASTDELIVATDSAPLIQDQLNGIGPEPDLTRIRLLKINLENGVNCSPVIINLK